MSPAGDRTMRPPVRASVSAKDARRIRAGWLRVATKKHSVRAPNTGLVTVAQRSPAPVNAAATLNSCVRVTQFPSTVRGCFLREPRPRASLNSATAPDRKQKAIAATHALVAAPPRVNAPAAAGASTTRAFLNHWPGRQARTTANAVRAVA